LIHSRFYNLAVAGASQFGTWDFAKWVPQAVVINLGTLFLSPTSLLPTPLFSVTNIAFVGTNDYSEPTANQPSASQYETGILSFLFDSLSLSPPSSINKLLQPTSISSTPLSNTTLQLLPLSSWFVVLCLMLIARMLSSLLSLPPPL
jgi:hypothetical protein